MTATYYIDDTYAHLVGQHWSLGVRQYPKIHLTVVKHVKYHYHDLS